MLSNPQDLEKCKACQAAKPNKPPGTAAFLAGKPNPLDKFKSSASQWECSSCMLKNDEAAVKCKACESAKPGAKMEKAAPNPLDKFKSSNKWECGSCMLQNGDNLDKCQACATPKSDAKKKLGSSNPLDKFKSSNQWECSACMLKNDEGVGKCKACETPNKNAASNGQYTIIMVCIVLFIGYI